MVRNLNSACSQTFVLFRYSEHYEECIGARCGHAEHGRSRAPAASRAGSLGARASRPSGSQPGNDQCHRERQDRYLGPAATPNRNGTRRTGSVAGRGSGRPDAIAERGAVLGPTRHRKLARVRSPADRPRASRGDQGVCRDRLPRGKHAVDRAVRQHERARRVPPLPQQTGPAGKDPRHHDDGPPLAAAARTRRREQSDREGRASRRSAGSLPHQAKRPLLHRRQRDAQPRAPSLPPDSQAPRRCPASAGHGDRSGHHGGWSRCQPPARCGEGHSDHVHGASAVVSTRRTYHPGADRQGIRAVRTAPPGIQRYAPAAIPWSGSGAPG